MIRGKVSLIPVDHENMKQKIIYINVILLFKYEFRYTMLVEKNNWKNYEKQTAMSMKIERSINLMIELSKARKKCRRD